MTTQDDFLRRKTYSLRYAQDRAMEAKRKARKITRQVEQGLPEVAILTRTQVTRAIAVVLSEVALPEPDLSEYYTEEISAYSVILAGVGARAAAEADATASYQRAIGSNYQGKTLEAWTGKIEMAYRDAVAASIIAGWAGRETSGQIMARVVEDGQVLVRDAQIIARSAVAHLSNQAVERSYERNADILRGKRWLSTLDGRTTLTCAARDGKLYTLDSKPVGHSLEWGAGPGAIHWQCRSTSVPVVRGESDEGTRAALDYNEKTKSKAASVVDGYGRGGQIDGSTTYGQWLQNQPAWFIEDTLGKDRAALFRSGALEIEQFTADSGRMLSINELKQRHPGAFK